MCDHITQKHKNAHAQFLWLQYYWNSRGKPNLQKNDTSKETETMNISWTFLKLTAGILFFMITNTHIKNFLTEKSLLHEKPVNFWQSFKRYFSYLIISYSML
jgi:uncharacterized protein with PQ loop repeat